METAGIAKVAVSAAPYSIDKPYDYLVPEPWLELAVPGVRATVPFGRGNRTSEGLILARGQGEKLPGLKPLTAVLDPQPVLDGDGIALALWLRGRYFCTMFEAARTLLPAGLWFRLRQIWRLTESGREAPEDCRTPVAQAAIDALQAAGGQAELERLEEAEAILLQDGGLIVPDIREGEQTMSEVWLALQQKKYGLGREAAEKIAPVPYRMDFRMN